MRRTNDSLNSMGRTMIATDKPTRAALKRLAEAEGLELSRYLRKIAEDNSRNKQIPLPSGLATTTESKIEAKLGLMMAKIEALDEVVFNRGASALSEQLLASMAWALGKNATEKDREVARQQLEAHIKDRGLQLGLSEA